MSYSYLLDNNSNVKFNVKNSLTTSDTTSSTVHRITATGSDKHVIHTVDDLGYHVRNGLTNQKLLSINHSNTLNDCVVKREINTTVAPINTTIATHETRISNIEGVTNISSLEIEDILGNGNNANNLSITGLDNIDCNTINIEGISLSNNSFGQLSIDATIKSTTELYAPMINCEELGCGGVITSTNITDMQNRINVLETYIEELKLFIVALKDGIYIESDIGSGEEYNYSSII